MLQQMEKLQSCCRATRKVPAPLNEREVHTPPSWGCHILLKSLLGEESPARHRMCLQKLQRALLFISTSPSKTLQYFLAPRALLTSKDMV